MGPQVSRGGTIRHDRFSRGPGVMSGPLSCSFARARDLRDCMGSRLPDRDCPALGERVAVHEGIATPALRELQRVPIPSDRGGIRPRTTSSRAASGTPLVPTRGQRLPVPCRRRAARGLHESHGCRALGDGHHHPIRRLIGLARIRSVPRAVGSGEHLGKGHQYHVSRAGRLQSPGKPRRAVLKNTSPRTHIQRFRCDAVRPDRRASWQEGSAPRSGGV